MVLKMNLAGKLLGGYISDVVSLWDLVQVTPWKWEVYVLFSGMPPFSFLSANGMVDMTRRLSQKTIQLEEINIWQGWLPEGEDILR